VSDWVPGQRVGELAKSAGSRYSPAVLLSMVKGGTAFRFSADRVVPGLLVAEVNELIVEAKAAFGLGGDVDSSAFRAWLVRRCKALGLPVPQFGVDASRQGRGGRMSAGEAAAAGVTEITKMLPSRIDGVLRPANGAGWLLRKAGGEVAPGLAHKAAKAARKAASRAEKAEILAEAEAYAREAARMSDPAMAKGYADLAKELRAEAGSQLGPSGCAELLVKARECDAMARCAVEPALRAGYEGLARELRVKAGVA
jgi:hypothetical protein